VVAETSVTVHDATGAKVATLSSALDVAKIVAAGFDAAATRLALVTPDHARVYDIAKDAIVADVTFPYPVSEYVGSTTVTFDPDGKYLLLSSVGVEAYDLTTLKPLAAGLDTGTGGTFATIVSPDGRFVAAASDDGHSLKVWKTVSWTPLGTLAHVESCDNHFYGIFFTQGGKRLIGVANRLHVKMYDTATWKPVLSSTNKDVAHGSSFSDDGLVAFSIDDTQKATVYETKTAKVISTFPDPVGTLTPSADGGYALDNLSEKLVVWDAKTGSKLATIGR
jgi:WD40 repeat protein